MRKLFLSIAILSLVLVMACQQEKKVDYAIFSGQVTHAVSDSLTLFQSRTVMLKSIKLAEDGSFCDTLYAVEEGSYYLYDGSNAIEVYLKAGFNLSAQIDAQNMEVTQFTGEGAEENNYLVAKSKMLKEIAPLIHYSHYCELGETAFLNLNDSIGQVTADFFNQNKVNLDENFAFVQDQSFKYAKLLRVHYYQLYNTYYLPHETPFKVSENYPNPFERISYEDARLAKVEPYINLLDEHIRSFVMTDSVKEGQVQRMIVRADTLIQNAEIKEAYLAKFSEDFLETTDGLDATFETLKSKISCSKVQDKMQKTYTELKKVEKGQASPSFNLKDIDGNMVSLESLKGKLVYIDVWATWCGPCRGELPSLKALEKEMQKEDIYFVSMCVWDKEPNWEKFVKEQELEGIQLFCPRENDAFVNAYRIKGVPRFILLDKEGKIIDNNAKRPSNPKLKEQIKSLL